MQGSELKNKKRELEDLEDQITHWKNKLRNAQDQAERDMEEMRKRYRNMESQSRDLKDELIKNWGNTKQEKEHIKEIIEKHGSGDQDGLLRDILFAIKELNNQKKDDFKPVLVEENEGSR